MAGYFPDSPRPRIFVFYVTQNKQRLLHYTARNESSYTAHVRVSFQKVNSAHTQPLLSYFTVLSLPTFHRVELKEKP